MRVFVTGATGYIGSAICEELIQGGHTVWGMARSEDAAAKLHAAGVTPLRGDLRDPRSLTVAARGADAVIHTAMAWVPESGAVDEAAVRALLEANKLLLYTSGTWVIGDTKGHVAGELAMLRPPPIVAWRPAVEKLSLDAAGIVIRPARVFGRGAGSTGAMVREAREQGVVRVIGDGEHHWSFVHVESLANLYRLAVEQAPRGEVFLAAEGTPFRVIELAEAIAKLWNARIEKTPVEEARLRMGPVVDALVMDQRIASTKAGRVLGWNLRRPNVIEEILRGSYSPSVEG